MTSSYLFGYFVVSYLTPDKSDCLKADGQKTGATHLNVLIYAETPSVSFIETNSKALKK